MKRFHAYSISTNERGGIWTSNDQLLGCELPFSVIFRFLVTLDLEISKYSKMNVQTVNSYGWHAMDDASNEHRELSIRQKLKKSIVEVTIALSRGLSSFPLTNDGISCIL